MGFFDVMGWLWPRYKPTGTVDTVGAVLPADAGSVGFKTAAEVSVQSKSTADAGGVGK